ncbi:Formamidopyrimidine-DNA glycosylase [Grifola frondosa]|uniref:Formamidopyrimidine-DNA glycosylase n=1 Tax=Grifola frondosa TaxID=5627 RepID=A0A1C7MQ11_GRIFR|nr:Formamidopyrimidine-DNA glycosylase [Grifola frondosa]
MPELPEVERATRLVRDIALNKKIVKVETVEDTIVFSGVSHNIFYTGKVFYIELDGKGKMPVLHFGMTGMLQVKGQLPTYYKETPRKASTDWPPRFVKFILHILDESDGSVTELAFLDARRLGRIRLCTSPLTEPPISTLGFDPILSMPDLEYFKKGVRKRSCPIKALLLDQSFSAGVGNWVADEILYHARVHPEQRCNVFTDPNSRLSIHKLLKYAGLPSTSTLMIPSFPITGCLNTAGCVVRLPMSKFAHIGRAYILQGKGKKEKHTMTLPTGEPATIKWITVGGRTSAYVAELQKLTVAGTMQVDQDSESNLTSLLASERDAKPTTSRKRKVLPLRASLRVSSH